MKTINDAKLAKLQQESAKWEALARDRAVRIEFLRRHIESIELELLELTAEADA